MIFIQFTDHIRKWIFKYEKQMALGGDGGHFGAISIFAFLSP